MTEWLGPNAAGLAHASIPPTPEPTTRSPLLAFHDGTTRSDICAEIYRSLDYLLDGPDPVSGAVQLVFPLRACGTSIDGMTIVPLPVWDKVVRLSGFEMIHPVRGAKTVAAVPGPVDPNEGSGWGSDDEMSVGVLDPALRDTPMLDVGVEELDPLLDLGLSGEDEKFAALLQDFGS